MKRAINPASAGRWSFASRRFLAVATSAASARERLTNSAIANKGQHPLLKPQGKMPDVKNIIFFNIVTPRSHFAL
jgi:hypothetical protein